MLFQPYFVISVIVVVAAICARLYAGKRDPSTSLVKYYFGDKFGLSIVIIGGVLSGISYFMFGRVHVIASATDFKTYWTIGKPMYTINPNKIVTLDPHCIVNLTDKILVLENVVYGDRKSEEMPTVIGANDTKKISTLNIQYYPDETPPDKIKTKTGGASQYWLRFLTDHELQMITEELNKRRPSE